MTISLAFLAPDLAKAAIEGRLPHGIGATRLTDLPAESGRNSTKSLNFLTNKRIRTKSLDDTSLCFQETGICQQRPKTVKSHPPKMVEDCAEFQFHRRRARAISNGDRYPLLLARRAAHMNGLTASIIVALVCAIVFIAVALITAPARIGVLPANVARGSSSPPGIEAELPESATKFRVLGWLIVVSLYLMVAFCLLQGLNDLRISRHWDRWEASFGSLLADRAEIDLYARFWIATAIALFFIGYWAQRRLTRRAT